jgi:uncharacterized protein (TIGR02117 family)
MRRLALTVAALLLPPLAYIALAVTLGLAAVNPQFVPTPAEHGGVPVYLRTNGVHADLVLPAVAPYAPYDWTSEFPPTVVLDAVRAPAAGTTWIAFGWGDRAFYMHTPTWRELRPGVAWRALTGQQPAAMHVEYVARPQDYGGQMLWLNADQYRDLVAYLQAGFARDAQGAPIRIDHPGYFRTDAFFEGTGHYSMALTSNEWVRRGLARAGVRTARWAPFEPALFWHAARAGSP